MMIDVQSMRDDRRLEIEQAGVSDLRYPIIVLDRRQEKQHTIARISMSVGLPHHLKGTHMSRFLEILHEDRAELTIRTLPALLQKVKHRLDAETARIEARFPYFIEKSAPATGAKSLMDYECTFAGEVNGGAMDFVLSVRVPVTSLCPCSKAISDYGAHNQRGFIEIDVRSVLAAGEPELIWIEELVDVAERSASAPIYPLLKRPDERFVTMQAFENPVFVEDMVRNVGTKLRDDRRVAWFRVKATNEESIHNHSAFAELSLDRREGTSR
jgi:GTP cyclohydrolase IB